MNKKQGNHYDTHKISDFCTYFRENATFFVFKEDLKRVNFMFCQNMITVLFFTYLYYKIKLTVYLYVYDIYFKSARVCLYIVKNFYMIDFKSYKHIVKKII